MEKLCEDLLNLIFQFCDNKTSFRFALCSKYIHESTLRYGFAKFLRYDYPKCDFNYFMKRFIRHHGSITTCIVKETANGFYWLPQWVERIYFENCRIRDLINPSNITKTKFLNISTPIYTWEINIQWDKFPDLVELIIKGYWINLEGISSKCKHLKRVHYEPTLLYSHSGLKKNLKELKFLKESGVFIK